jgi:hypothetical protein
MTVQTCCGDIPSDDPNVNESSQPYMTKNCYNTGEWNLTECTKDCCGSPDATCVPTNQGGYCELDGQFYKYLLKPGNQNKERLSVNKNEALRETDYRKGSRRAKDFPNTNEYNQGRYRDMKRKVLQDMRNEQMNLGIITQKDPLNQNVPFTYSSIFQVSDWVPYVMGILNVFVFVFIVYVLLQYLK